MAAKSPMKIALIVLLLAVAAAGAWLVTSGRMPSKAVHAPAEVTAANPTGKPVDLSGQPEAAKQAYEKYEDMAAQAAQVGQQRAAQMGQFAAKCTQIMTDFAVKNNAEPAAYIEQNQEYYKQCIQSYAAQVPQPQPQTQQGAASQ